MDVRNAAHPMREAVLSNIGETYPLAAHNRGGVPGRPHAVPACCKVGHSVRVCAGPLVCQAFDTGRLV